MMDEPTEDDKKRFVVLVRYERINPKQFWHVGSPEIDEGDGAWGPEYRQPVVTEVVEENRGKLRLEVRHARSDGG